MANPADAAKFDDVPGDYLRVVVGTGRRVRVCRRRRLAVAGVRHTRPPYPLTAHPGTAPGDPLLLYFTSGTTSKPKLVEHTQVSYPVGHLARCTGSGCSRGTCT